MIDSESLSKKWIHSQKHGQLGEEIVEKACRSLFLVEQMAQAGIDFVFKGGSCMMLFFDPPRRFSTDVDILISEEEAEKLIDWLSRFGPNDLFYNPKPDVRGNEKRLNMAHYKVSYNSVLSNQEATLVLDLLFEPPLYRHPKKDPIKCSFLKYNSAMAPSIKHPSAADLLADKLTAFAPNTVGLLYSDKKPLDIVKQLYDVAQLSSLQGLDYAEVYELYQDIAFREMGKRDNCKGKTPDDCLKDTLDACACALCGEDYLDQNYAKLTCAIPQLANYIQDYTSVTLVKTAASVFRFGLILYSGGLQKYNDDLSMTERAQSIGDILPLSSSRIKMLQFDLKKDFGDLEEAIRVYGFHFQDISSD